MNFGEYLLNKNLISSQDFIHCRIEQMRAMPTTLEAMVDLNVYPVDKLASLLNEASRKKCDLYNVLEDDVKEKVDSFVESTVKSFAEVLLTNELVTRENLIQWLQEFKSEKHQDDSSSVSVSSTESLSSDGPGDTLISEAALESLKELQGDSFDPSLLGELNQETQNSISESEHVASNAETEVSQAALESLKELGISPEELKELEGSISSPSDEKTETQTLNSLSTEIEASRPDNDYSLIFTKKRLSKLDKIYNMIIDAAEKKEEVSNYLNSLFREIHVIKGAAALIGAKKSKVVLETWEHAIDLLFEKSNEGLIDWVSSHIEKLRTSIDLLWAIREAIQDDKSEDSFLMDLNNKEKYIGCITALKEMIQALKK